MNAGFSSLSALKVQLLNADLRSSTDYDDLILAVGRGMAGLIGGYCNREFARVVGDTFIAPGNTRLLNLPRFPVEAVTALDFKVRLTNAWQDGLNALYNWNASAGIVDLAYYLTDRHGQVRVTYTGGYWWPTAEGDPASIVIGALRRYGIVPVASAAQQVAIVFSSPLPVAPASVNASIVKSGGGADDVFVTGLVGLPTTTGCVVRLSAPAPDDSYQLCYEATGDLTSPAGDAGSLPDGATALPDAIRSAWILQCEEVWRRRDALGLTPAFVKAELRPPMLTGLELLPIVKDMLRDQIRFSP